jgi:uncharacterized protein YaaQ
VWEFHPAKDCVLADDLSAQIFGSGSKRGMIAADEFLCGVDDDSRRELLAMLHDACGEQGPQGVRHRMADAKGRVHTMYTRATRVQVNDESVVLCTTEAATGKS